MLPVCATMRGIETEVWRELHHGVDIFVHKFFTLPDQSRIASGYDIFASFLQQLLLLEEI